jgi:hypothetical protein
MNIANTNTYNKITLGNLIHKKLDEVCTCVSNATNNLL